MRMQSSDVTSFASPFDDFFQKYIPREHEKALRNSFIQAVAIVSVGAIFFGLYYVYSILEPFCIPLFWAFLTGIVLHPYKRDTTKVLRMALENLHKSEQTMVVAMGMTILVKTDNLAEMIGTYFTKKWKVILSACLVLPLTYITCYLCPDAFSWVLELLQEIFLVDLSMFLNSVSLHHVVAMTAICLISVTFGNMEYQFMYKTMAMVTWLMLGAYFMNFFWPPLVYMMVLLWVYGYCSEPAQSDQPDGSPGSQDSRIKSVIISFLGQIGVLGVDEADTPQASVDIPDVRRVSDPAPTTSTPLPHLAEADKLETLKQQDPTQPENTPKIVKTISLTANLENTPKGVTLADTPKVAVIQHPGVSKLQKEHGILRSREKPNINMSGIENLRGSGRGEIGSEGRGRGNATLGGNTPRSRIMGRSYFRAKRRPSLHKLGGESWTYIRWALWACALLQLWVRPTLIHLLPGPIAYHMIKRISGYTGLSEFIRERAGVVLGVARAWVEERKEMLFPPPFLFLVRVSYSVERKVLKGISTYLDSIVTALMILAMVLGITMTGIFISFQVYAESVYVVQSAASITSTLNMNDSYIFMKLNHSLSGGEYGSMENVVDGAYNYGRDWISRTLQQTLSEADNEVKKDLEIKVLELWDRSYQYWVLTAPEEQKTIGPSVNGEAITSSVGEVLAKLYNSSNLLNISAIQTFIHNNMGTLTSIMEQVWTLFKGNIGFLFDTILGILRIILHGGSGVVNFVFSIVIYLTALFYLLSNSEHTYIPMDFVSQYSLFQISGVGSSIQKAVNSVFLITIKMSSFYLLWTYMTHVVFGASIVVLPLLFSSFIAACPITGQYIVALPAALELYCLQQRPVAALLLVIMQVAPSWLVDTAIYSEIKGGIHPWFTGLAVVGGVYVFGVLGAIYGPLGLCVLYVVINVYSTFMAETEPETPDIRGGHTTGVTMRDRTPLLRSGTIA